MQRNYDFPKKEQQYGWNTTSVDYHSHISKIERMASALNEAPSYPNVYKAFNNKYNTYEGDQEKENRQREVEQNQNQTQKSSPPPDAKTKKKVQVTERVEVAESAKIDDDDDDDDGGGGGGGGGDYDNKKNYEVRDDTVDTQADGFIQRKRKTFELCKWRTFKS